MVQLGLGKFYTYSLFCIPYSFDARQSIPADWVWVIYKT